MRKPLTILLAVLILASNGLVQGVQAESESKLIEKVRAEYAKGDYEKAIALLQEDMKNNPEDGTTHFYLGLVKKEMGEDLPALDELELAARLLPAETLAAYTKQAIDTAKAGQTKTGVKTLPLPPKPKDWWQSVQESFDLSKPFQMEELRVRSVKLMEQREQLRKTFQRTLVLEPAEIAVNSRDEIFLENLKNLLEENLADPDFQKNQLAAGLGVSGKQMDRKLNALTGNASGQFIRLFRLKRAADLLKEGAGNVTEICFSVGFQNTSHFAKVFKDTFGLSPKDYQNQHYHTDD